MYQISIISFRPINYSYQTHQLFRLHIPITYICSCNQLRSRLLTTYISSINYICPCHPSYIYTTTIYISDQYYYLEQVVLDASSQDEGSWYNYHPNTSEELPPTPPCNYHRYIQHEYRSAWMYPKNWLA